MTMRKHNLVMLVVLLGAGSAAADTQWEWRPRVSAMAGYDDNVQINGKGGDGFGQVAPGLKLDVFGEHKLHAAFDCQVGLARLQNPEEFGFGSNRVFANENCGLDTKVNLSERDKFFLRASATYAQDPFALAGLGLLLRPGQTNIFVGRLTVEDSHATSGHTGFNYGMDGAILTFGSNDPGNNYLLAPRARYEWKTSARSQWDFGVREQLFFGLGSAANPAGNTAGLLGEGHSALLGYRYELTPWSELTIRGGPAVVNQHGLHNGGTAAMPTARAEINAYTPSYDFGFAIGHDLVIGPSGGGAQVGDVAEVAGTRRWEKLAVHLVVGAYRNASAFDQYSAGTSGYGGQLGIDWHFTRNLSLGVSAERDARIYDPTLPGNLQALVNRNVAQLRLTYEKAQFN